MPAALNGFPFVLDDSAGYVSGERVIFHSVFYNLFVEATDLASSPWLVIAAQALIVSHLLWVWQRLLLGANRPALFLVSTAGLSALSSLGLVAGYLMPDIFTSVVILAIGLLAFERARLSCAEGIYLVGLATVAVAAHLSHIPVAAASVAAATAILLMRGETVRNTLASTAVAASPVVLAAGALFASNIYYFGLPNLSPAGPVFFAANLIGKGPAKDYLDEACPDPAFRVCSEIGQLGEGGNYFLWGGPLSRLGGFDGFRGEASRIASETLRTRPGAVATAAASAVAEALVTHRPGWDYRPLRGNTHWFERTIAERYGERAVAAWRTTLQARDEVPRTLLAALDLLVLPLSLLALLAGSFIAWGKRWTDVLSFNTLVLAGATANVVVCAVGSGVFDRYQTRVTWLIPLAAVLTALRLAASRPAAGLIPPSLIPSFSQSETA